MIEKETAGAICVLGATRRETFLTDEGSRLVAENAGDGDGSECTCGEGAEGRRVGRANNFGEASGLARLTNAGENEA